MTNQELKLLEENNQLLKKQIEVNKGLQNSLIGLSQTIPDLAKALGHDSKMNSRKDKENLIKQEAKKFIGRLNKNKQGKVLQITNKKKDLL